MGRYMVRLFLTTLWLFCLMACDPHRLPPTAQAAPQVALRTPGTRYVAPDGDDANPGTAEAPWATPGYASRQLQPGDTLILRAGRYVLTRYDEDIVTPPSGRADAWITLRGEEGARPVLAMGQNLYVAIDLAGAQYVRIENVEITHDAQASGAAAYARDGINALGAPARHIVLRGLYIHHLDEFGINLEDVEDAHILDCDIAYCGFGAIGGPEGATGWRDVTIERCRLAYGGHYYQGSNGDNRPYDRPDGLGLEPSPGPLTIVDTIAEHNRGDGLDSKIANTTIRRCVVANNSCDGVKLWGGGSLVENTLIYGRGDGDDTPTPWAALVIDTEQANARFELRNVTLDDTLGRNYLAYIQYDMPDVPIDLVIRNTILSGTGPNCPIWVASGTRLVAEYNLFYLPQMDVLLEHGAQTYTAANLGSLGAGNRYGDPLFTRRGWGTEGSYRLRAGSPAIGAANADVAPADDLDRRPRDAAPDIGAYEFLPEGAWRLGLPMIVS
jgi:hypothetical protein